MQRHELGLPYARSLDERDPLRSFRERFFVVDGEIYLDGNSLGLCSKDGEAAILRLLDVWKTQGIRIWNVEEGKYFLYPSFLGKKVAPLVGADADEVTVTNSTTINIHQAIATFYQPQGKRVKILVDDLNFSTDRYAIDSQIRLKGLDPAEIVQVVRSRDGRTIDEDDVIAAMSDEIAIVFLPSVLYRSAQLLDMARITREAHDRGILVGWDLCHSIGSVPHDLKAIDADFAVWCNYKYLNAGPGAVGGLFVNRKHFGKAVGLAGWHGNRKSTQFQLLQTFEQAPDADAFLTGTPPLLGMAALEGALDIFAEAGMTRVREKSLALTEYLMYLVDKRLAPYGYAVGNPREDARRGGHVALEHDEAYRICLALKTRGVIPDFREPNVVRLAPVALYVSFEDVHRCVDILEEIAATKAYEPFSHARSLVV